MNGADIGDQKAQHSLFKACLQKRDISLLSCLLAMGLNTQPDKQDYTQEIMSDEVLSQVKATREQLAQALQSTLVRL